MSGSGVSKPSPSSKPRRGRPSSIDQESILEAAIALGVPNITMRAIAQRLGVSDAALYHHFPSRQALVAAVVDATVRGASFPKDRAQDWREWMTEFAGTLRALLLANPGSAAFAATSGPTSPEQVELVATAIGVFLRCGFSEAEAAMIYSLVTNFVISSVQIQERRVVAQQQKRDIPSRFAKALQALGEDRARSLRTVADTWANTTPDQHFEYGLSAILRGVADRIAR